MLEDMGNVVEVLPSEPTNPSIFRNNLKMITIRAESTRYRS